MVMMTASFAIMDFISKTKDRDRRDAINECLTSTHDFEKCKQVME